MLRTDARGGGLILQVEGAEHIRERGFGPARAAAKRGRAHRFWGPRPAAAALVKIESAAARDGLPCAPLPALHSLAHLPRLSEGANLATARQTKTASPRTGHRPCPASAAQLMRPNDGQGWGEYGGGAEGGDKIVFLDVRSGP